MLVTHIYAKRGKKPNKIKPQKIYNFGIPYPWLWFCLTPLALDKRKKKITELQYVLGWKGFKDHPVQTPVPWEETPLTKQVAQSSIQTSIKHFPEWAVDNFCNLSWCLPIFKVKNFILLSNINLLSFNLKPLPLILSLHVLENSLSIFHAGCLQVLEGCN